MGFEVAQRIYYQLHERWDQLVNASWQSEKSLESYGVSAFEIEMLIESIVADPGLRLGDPEEGRRKLEPLLKYLKELK